MNFVFSDYKTLKMSFDSCINKDVIGCILQHCRYADQIALARTCTRAKRVFMQYAQTERMLLAEHACTHDEVGLFKLTHSEIELELYWIRVVEACSVKIMAYLLRRCNPNWNKCYALYRIIRSKHKNAINALCTLLADPMTHDLSSFAIDMATHSGNVDVLKILIADHRFIEVWPEVGWMAAISHDLSDACGIMVAKYPQYCDHYIYQAAQRGYSVLVQQMLMHVSMCRLRNLCNDLTIPYREMMMLRKELSQRTLCN